MSPLLDPLAPCFTAPDPGPSLAEQEAAREAESQNRAWPEHVQRFRLLRMAAEIVGRVEREGSRV